MTERTEQPEAPPATGTPPRTLAEELSDRAIHMPIDFGGRGKDAQTPQYRTGFIDACEAISADLLANSALQLPAPVAAGGAGQTMWAIIKDGEVKEVQPTEHWAKETCRAFAYYKKDTRVVPVIVTVLADDAGAGGAEGKGAGSAAEFARGIRITWSAQSVISLDRLESLVRRKAEPLFARLAIAESAQAAAESRALDLGTVTVNQALEIEALRHERDGLTVARDGLRTAIVTHHAQKADDRCIEDDDRLYAAAGLPPCDRRVGDKAAMLQNCQRFIERRCEGGGWPSYAELEAERNRLIEAVEFYAADDLWEEIGTSTGSTTCEAMSDGGARARAALAAPAGGAAGEGGQAK